MIGGFDPHDSTSSPEPMPDLAGALTGDVKGLRIGVPRAFLGEGVDDAILDGVRGGARACSRLAARRSSTSICRTPPYGIPVYYLICTAEASSNLARYDGVRYGHAHEARERRHAADRCTSARATRASAPK